MESAQVAESLSIEQDNTKYILNVNSVDDNIFFNLDYNYNHYFKRSLLKEIKDKDSKAIFTNFSCNDFIKFIKTLSEMKKISVVQKENNVLLKFEAELLLIKYEIEIELINKIQNMEIIEKELKEIKQENSELKNKIEILETKYEKLSKEQEKDKKELNELKTEMNEMKKNMNQNYNIKQLNINNKSSIMKENEFDMINTAIKVRLNKDVKDLIKLYQASIDGDNAINFHTKCDSIPNTLVLYKSAGNRRFGGFTTVGWSSPTSGESKDDPKAFLFSLDKQKIYSYKNKGNAIYIYKEHGPIFGSSPCDIVMYDGFLKKDNKRLFTSESYSNCSFNYDGDNNALSEDGKSGYINALELEVFHVVL